MKNFIKILGVVLLLCGSAVSVFSTVTLVDCIAIGVAALGLALLIGSTLKKVEKRTWKDYLAVCLFAVAGFLCGIAGIAEGTFTQIATAVTGLISLIIGLVTVGKKV